MKRLLLLVLLFSIISCARNKSQNNIEKTIPQKSIQKAFYKEVKASHFITPRPFLFDENELTELKTKGLILEIISEGSNIEEYKNKWNKYYYQDLTHHYFKEDVLMEGAKILGVVGKTQNDIAINWPRKITEEQYKKLHEALKINLTFAVELKDNMKGKFVITPNPEFWTFTTQTDYPLLVDILSTYEREFEDFELIHKELDEALDYAVIIFETLCNQRGPDNPYYYNQITLDQFEKLPEELKIEFESYQLKRHDGLPRFEFNSYSTDKIVDYENIINSRRDDIDVCKRIFTNLPKPPFFIVKVL